MLLARGLLAEYESPQELESVCGVFFDTLSTDVRHVRAGVRLGASFAVQRP